ncbi:MAG: dipeptidase PepV [Clostridiales bacterium]|nr:dipeptidase PepV [Clostridiales bacterium]
MRYDSLNQKISQMRDELVEAVRQSVAIPSVKGEPAPGAPYGPGPKAALENALALSRRLGLTADSLGNRVGWTEYGSGPEMVMALGHLDVVPAGDGWTYPPFGGQVHGGRMYGRGVLDDKGPVIGAIFGLKAIQELELPTRRRIRVMFGTDEEQGSSCVDYYIRQGGELPSAGFTPDGEYPLIFFEKGISQFTIGKTVTDPGDGRVVSLRGGTAANVVTPACTLTLSGEPPCTPPGLTVRRADGKTVIEAVGVSAHGSTPAQGENAAYKLFTALDKVRFSGDFQRMADFIREQLLGETDGRRLGVYTKDAETGETTVNLGRLSYDGKAMSFTLDIRYPRGADPEAVSRRIREKAAAYGLEVLEEKRLPMLYVSKQSPLVRTLMGVYQIQTGRQAEPLAIGGGTYAKAFQNMVAFGPLFPGEPEVIHQPDEWVDIDTLIRSVQITAAAMWELAR